MSSVRIRIRRDTASNWLAANPVLLGAEFGYETDTRKLKIGDGATTWNDLPYWSSTSAAYVHLQQVPANAWTINHNLGYRPAVELLDTGGQEIDADIAHPSVNQTVVTLNPATAGLARLT